MIVKECACGAAYTAQAWASLRFVGTVEVPADPDEPEAYALELRNCPCGSTLAQKIIPTEPTTEDR